MVLDEEFEFNDVKFYIFQIFFFTLAFAVAVDNASPISEAHVSENGPNPPIRGTSFVGAVSDLTVLFRAPVEAYGAPARQYPSYGVGPVMIGE